MPSRRGLTLIAAPRPSETDRGNLFVRLAPRTAWKLASSFSDDGKSQEKAGRDVDFLPLEIVILPKGGMAKLIDEGGVNSDGCAVIYSSYNGGAPITDGSDFFKKKFEQIIEMPFDLHPSLRSTFNSTSELIMAHVRPLFNVPCAQRVTFEPLTVSDWEMIEMEATVLEDGGLLNQVTIVSVGQILPLRFSGRLGTLESAAWIKVVSISTDTSSSRDTNKKVSDECDALYTSDSEFDSSSDSSIDCEDDIPGVTVIMACHPCVRLMAETEVIIIPKPRERKKELLEDKEHSTNVNPVFCPSSPLRVQMNSSDIVHTSSTDEERLSLPNPSIGFVSVHPSTLLQLPGYKQCMAQCDVDLSPMVVTIRRVKGPYAKYKLETKCDEAACDVVLAIVHASNCTHVGHIGINCLLRYQLGITPLSDWVSVQIWSESNVVKCISEMRGNSSSIELSKVPISVLHGDHSALNPWNSPDGFSTSPSSVKNLSPGDADVSLNPVFSSGSLVPAEFLRSIGLVWLDGSTDLFMLGIRSGEPITRRVSWVDQHNTNGPLKYKNDTIRAEVTSLCQRTNSPKTPEDLLALYKGREDILLENLRKLLTNKQEGTKNVGPLNANSCPVPIITVRDLKELSASNVILEKDDADNYAVINNSFVLPIADELTVGFASAIQEVNQYARQIISEPTITNASLSIRTHAIMITGEEGSGKTHLSINSTSKLCVSDLIATVYLDCKKLQATAKNIQQILEGIQDCFLEALYKQPSTLVLDDLDALIPNVEHSDAEGDGSIHHHQLNPALLIQVKIIVDHLLTLSKHCSRGSTGVVLLCTCRDRDSLSTRYQESGVFHSILEVPSFDSLQRAEFLHYIIHGRSNDVIPHAIIRLGKDTDGFRPKDLKIVATRIVHKDYVRCFREPSDSVDTRNEMLEVDIASILDNYSSLSQQLVDVDRNSPSTDWSSIGGLHEARKSLYDIVIHPMKFKSVYANAPMALPTGLLLYGPPGNGKSFIVPLLAKQAKLTLITCRGPELLDRYIGASEAKVRQLFARAVAAAPSMIFFDEFDSLAPQRGSDHTGVTDRVVNQLLTLLDGAERSKKANHIYVVAATSRPDKIDKALLRPGRLEKHVYVGHPESLSEWNSLFASLLGSRNIDEEVALIREDGNCISSFCQGCEYAKDFSAADMKAVLDTAHLLCVHEILDRAEVTSLCQKTNSPKTPDELLTLYKGREDVLLENLRKVASDKHEDTKNESPLNNGGVPDMPPAILGKRHILEAFKRTRPSLLPNDKQCLQRIYASFGDHQTTEENIIDKVVRGLKTSLR